MNSKLNKSEKHTNKAKPYLKYALPVLLSVLVPYQSIAEAKANTTEKLEQNFSTWRLDIDDLAEVYIQNNLFINWESITNDKFDFEFKKNNENNYTIKYENTLKDIDWNDIWPLDFEIKINTNYDNNNVFIQIQSIKIENQEIWWKEFIVKDVVYDIEINEWENKSIMVNHKINQQKTKEHIEQKILKTDLSLQTTIPTVKDIENCQATKLNDVALWKEIFNDWNNFYRSIYFTQDNQYRELSKVYFDKKWNLILNEKDTTNKITLLWIDVKYKLQKNWNNVSLSYNSDDINALVKKIRQDRNKLISTINTAKVWPNKSFTWFNKKEWTTARSKWEKVWSFDTKLLWLNLINDTYTFQRWDKKENTLLFDTKWEKLSIKNNNLETVALFFVSIDDANNYQISLWEELSIDKIKKEVENKENILPKFEWESQITSILNNEELNIDKTSWQLYYFNNDGSLVSKINTKQNKDWTYNLNQNNTKVDIVDLYRFSKFKSIVSSITEIKNKLNILDIDILSTFKTLLKENFWELQIDWIKVVWEDIYYSNINGKNSEFSLELNQKLYNAAEKTLESIKNRLEIVQKLSETKILRSNDWKTEDFTKFVWWWRGIGLRYIDPEQINAFVSQKSSQIDLDILRWEGDKTTVTYDISVKSWKVKLMWKSKVTIDWQTYKLKITDNFNIILDPVELK